jgi:hypothetical protein
MPARYSHRFPRDLDFAMRVFQVDSSWYENYWLKGAQAATGRHGRSKSSDDSVLPSPGW